MIQNRALGIIYIIKFQSLSRIESCFRGITGPPPKHGSRRVSIPVQDRILLQACYVTNAKVKGKLKFQSLSRIESCFRCEAKGFGVRSTAMFQSLSRIESCFRRKRSRNWAKWWGACFNPCPGSNLASGAAICIPCYACILARDSADPPKRMGGGHPERGTKYR